MVKLLLNLICQMEEVRQGRTFDDSDWMFSGDVHLVIGVGVAVSGFGWVAYFGLNNVRRVYWLAS